MELLKSEIINLLQNEKEQDILFEKADFVRKQSVGNKIYLRGLIEFSNICRNNCLYCGIRAGNKKVIRYHLSEEQIVSTAHRAFDLGFKTVVLQSGEDMSYSCESLCRIIEKIKQKDIIVTLSIGERDYKDYYALKNSGADRYLMRIETTDRELYHKLDPNMSWQRRYECLMMLKELKYELGSGIMVGLPGQTIESIADDLLFLKKIEIDMAGIGAFIPHPDTPLKDCQPGNLGLSLRTLSVMRLLMPNINMPATTAIACLSGNNYMKALNAGANVVMLNVMDNKYRKLYELYPYKERSNETADSELNRLKIDLQSQGQVIDIDER